MTEPTRSGGETRRAAPYEGTQPSETTDYRPSSPDTSAAQGHDDEYEADGDFMDYDCTWCSGEGQFWGSELPDYDPGWHLPDELYPCPACHGTGARKEQVLF